MPYVSSNKNPRIKIIISTLVVLALVVFIFLKSGIDPKQITTTLSQLDGLFLLLALLMSLLQVLFWILRPWPLVPYGTKLSFLSLARAISIGQFLNAFAPARAGDVTKVLLLSSSKLRNPLKSSTAVGLLATDKIIDIVAILLLAFFSGATSVDTKNLTTDFPFVYLLLLPLALGAVWIFLGKSFKNKMKGWFQDFLTGLKPLFSPKAFTLSLLFGLCVWIAEALSILLILKASGNVVQFSEAVYLMCIVNLGILIPVSFANVGAFEAAFVFGASKFGIGAATGVALAIAQHSVQALAMTSWAIAMFRMKEKSNQIDVIERS